MANLIAVTEAFKNLAEAESHLNLRHNTDPAFFPEWRDLLPDLSAADRDRLTLLHHRLQYHRAQGDLLEGAVMLLVASPLLELAGFYDPPFRLQAETSVELSISDGEETLRGRIDALVLRQDLWVLVIEAKKTTISTRSALPQALAYLAANPHLDRPSFGLLTNGDDVLFLKLTPPPDRQYSLSRAFSLYTVAEEWPTVLQILRAIGQN